MYLSKNSLNYGLLNSSNKNNCKSLRNQDHLSNSTRNIQNNFMIYVQTLGCDGYGARMAGIANQSGGIAPSNTEQGLGFLNAYFSSIGAAGKQSGPSFLPASRPGFANYSFARFLSSDITNKLGNNSSNHHFLFMSLFLNCRLVIRDTP